MKQMLPVLALLLSLPLVAQEVSEEISVNLVELDVKVTDWRGRYISGLTKDDFLVKEDGAEQTIERFEEVNLKALPQKELEAYQPRLMLVLDLKNSKHQQMARTFPLLKSYAKGIFDGKTQIGLAINTQGIVEIQPFTSDAQLFLRALDRVEALYKKSRYRLLSESKAFSATFARQLTTGYGQQTVGQRMNLQQLLAQSSRQPYSLQAASREFSNHSRVLTGGYFYSEIKVLEQFVNYLSAYRGKKIVVLVSEVWQTPLESKYLRDLVTTCLRHKVSINVLGMTGTPEIAEDRFKTTAADQNFTFVGQQSGLASATSGYYFTGNVRKLKDNLTRTVEDNERYYRIHYYSNSPDRKFRKIKVKTGRKNHNVRTFSGYSPLGRELNQKHTGLGLAVLEGGDLELALNTAWMSWSRDGLNKRQAYYVVGQHAYDDNGHLVGEKVDAGQLFNAKQSNGFPQVPLVKRYKLDSSHTNIDRIVFTVVDLNSGKRVEIEHRPEK